MPIVLEIIAAIYKLNPHNMPANRALHTFFDQLPYGLLVATCILYYTLPQGILLWTEQDADQIN